MHSVQIVEHETSFRRLLVEGIRLHPSLFLASSSITASAAQRALARLPDILVIDLLLPCGGAIALIRQAALSGKTRCLVFSNCADDPELVIEAIQAGASGFISKHCGMAEAINAIAHTLEGHAPLSLSITRHLVKKLQQDAPAPVEESACPVLSDRELEVLELLNKGLKTREMTQALGLSYHTGVAHLRNIYKKMDVSSRTEAIFEAEQLGLFSRYRSGLC